MDLSISIVSYNTQDLLSRCLKSIYKYTKGIRFEVIVVDNNSNDGTIETISNFNPFDKLRVDAEQSRSIKSQISNFKYIQNRRNLFFSKANNQALKIAKGRYFLILAPDSYLVNNSLKKMVDYMEENPDVGACEGLEVYENGTLVPTGSKFSTPLIDFYELSFIGKRFKNRKMIDVYRIANKRRDKTFDIDVGCDAFLMVRKDILDKIGGYDKKLLLYYTENDLCLRIKKLGYKIVHLGGAKVIHTVSASVKKLGFKKIDIYYQDMLWYYRKHGYKVTGTLLFFLLKLEEVVLRFIKQY